MALGTACCVLSALGYTAANACMRELAAQGADQMWAVCVKEAVTVAVVGPWVLWRSARRPLSRQAKRWIGLLALTGLCTQLGGNLPVQWAYGVVGMAVTIPTIFAVMLTASAGLGWLLLGERVPRRTCGAIGLLVAAIALLSLGAAAAGGDGPNSPEPWRMALGVGAACLAGALFAFLTIAIRTSVSRILPVTTVVVVITGMGVLTLGPMSLGRLGPQQLLATPGPQWALMLAAGTFNLLAFLAITKGLEYTTAVHANVLNAGQVAMGALLGVMVFGESWNSCVVVGVGLTVVGLVLVTQPRHDEQEVPSV